MKLFFRKSGSGKPLIILHGLFGMSDNWMTLAKRFSESGFLVYAPDARNHGHSPHDNDFDYEVMSEDLLTLMDDEQIEKADIIGHSMGAKTGMWFACTHPERISKFIASDMAPRYYAPHHETVLAAIHSVNLQSMTSRKDAEARMREILHDESTLQFLLKNLYWKEESKLAWRFNLDAIEKNISKTGEALPDAYHFDGPTLFLRGEKSGYITASDEADIKKHFPDSKIETVKGAGHWIHAENPEGFMSAALKFLE